MSKTILKNRTPIAVAEPVPIQKLYAPVQAHRVERRLILQRVFRERASSVVILQAPAGHGKTMMLGQIKQACEARGMESAWLNLDETDNDSRRHAHHLRALIEQVVGKAKISTQILSKEGLRRPPQRADWLIEALAMADHEIALFIDEFEVMTDRSNLTFWRDFLLRHPPSVRIFMATRTSPEIGVAELMVRDQLLLLSAEDLRFSRDEVTRYFVLHREIALQPAEIEAIYRRSEGWPAAVQLFRLSLSNPSTRNALGAIDQSRPRELAEYLTDSVLAGQPKDVRDFLLQTSILSRLTGPLCNELTGRSDSQQMLLRLEREGLFVRPLDTEQHLFRYHPLFASLLREQLGEENLAAMVPLHRRASNWYWDAGHHEEAMHHAIAAHDFELACQILRQWSSKLIASGEMTTIGRWLDAIPTNLINSDWTLTIRSVWSLTFLHRPSKLRRQMNALAQLRTRQYKLQTNDDSAIARAVSSMCSDNIDEAHAIISSVPQCDNSVSGFEAFEQAAAENLRAYLSIFSGNHEAAHLHLTRARSFNHLGEATFSGGYTACFKGALLLLEGHVNTALECLRDGIEQQQSVLDSSYVSSAIASCYLWTLYEANDLDMVEAVEKEYRDILSDAAVPDFFAVGQICISRTHAIRERTKDATLTLENAQYVATSNGWPRLVAMFEVEKRAQSLRGPKRSSNAKIREPSPNEKINSEQTWASPASDLMRSAQFLVASVPGEAPPVAKTSGQGHPYRELKHGVEKAIANHVAGRHGAAMRAASQAMKISSRTGLVRPVLDYGPLIIEVLRDLLESDPQYQNTNQGRLAYQLVFGRAISNGLDSRHPAKSKILNLKLFTPREREILGLLARRLSNKEIAQRTMLSENTVKFHLKNIFAKLTVKSRLEAYSAIVRLDLMAIED